MPKFLFWNLNQSNIPEMIARPPHFKAIDIHSDST